ncbi:MAG: RES family NAD+ phosphorylase [Gemmatimonadales bacterium]
MPWRVFPWDPAARPGEPFSPAYVHPHQGAGRFDLAGAAVLYLAETADHAVAEKLQRFRGQRLQRFDLTESGRPLALVECEIAAAVWGRLADLCDPRVLVRHEIAPDVLASRDLTTTRAVAKRLHGAGHAGLRWWSMLSGDWHALVLFLPPVDALRDLQFGQPDLLGAAHPAVQAAGAALGLRFA